MYMYRSEDTRVMSKQQEDLCSAVASGDVKSVQRLLELGIDVNQHSSEGFAPLCIAAFWGYADIVELLLSHGADVNITNRGTGWTACHCAAFQGHGKVLLYLMPHKPDVTLQDSMGRTAADFGSAQDSVWSFFATMGCRRTAKSELLQMDIVKKVAPDSDPVNSAVTGSKAHSTRAVHLSRPGSAYVIQSQSLSHTHAPSVALSHGDVLMETEENN